MMRSSTENCWIILWGWFPLKINKWKFVALACQAAVWLTFLLKWASVTNNENCPSRRDPTREKLQHARNVLKTKLKLFYKNKKETSKRFIVAGLMTYFLSVFCILRVQLIIDVKNYVARQDVLTCSSNYRGFFPRRSLCFKLCFRSTFPRKKKLAFVMNKVIIHV